MSANCDGDRHEYQNKQINQISSSFGEKGKEKKTLWFGVWYYDMKKWIADQL